MERPKIRPRLVPLLEVAVLYPVAVVVTALTVSPSRTVFAAKAALTFVLASAALAKLPPET